MDHPLKSKEREKDKRERRWRKKRREKRGKTEKGRKRKKNRGKGKIIGVRSSVGARQRSRLARGFHWWNDDDMRTKERKNDRSKFGAFFPIRRHARKLKPKNIYSWLMIALLFEALTPFPSCRAYRIVHCPSLRRRIGELFDDGFPFEIAAGDAYDSIPRLLGRATVDLSVRREREVRAIGMFVFYSRMRLILDLILSLILIILGIINSTDFEHIWYILTSNLTYFYL